MPFGIPNFVSNLFNSKKSGMELESNNEDSIQSIENSEASTLDEFPEESQDSVQLISNVDDSQSQDTNMELDEETEDEFIQVQEAGEVVEVEDSTHDHDASQEYSFEGEIDGFNEDGDSGGAGTDQEDNDIAENEPDNFKENGDHDQDSEVQHEDDIEETCLEITRRRLSQDREGNCYCGKDRNLNIAELLCASCNRWYHESCIGYQLGKLVPFMTNYIFSCKNCSQTGLESFKRQSAQFSQMCTTALANLTQASVKEGICEKYFSKERDIDPFFDMHWDGMTTRKFTQSCHTSVAKALHKEEDLFMCEERPGDPDSPYFALIPDLTTIRPNYEAMIKGGSLKVTELSQGATNSLRGRGAKRRTALDTTVTSQATVAKRSRGDLFLPKMITGHGYPTDHPYNKDGYRYMLAEPDPNAPFRQEFDESSDCAGKPIPGFLYRVLTPPVVLLALHDRAPQIKVSDDRLTALGEKGYCMIRATHGVSSGAFYFEAQIKDLPDGGAIRIGFSRPNGNLQGPLGYDKYGYSWRSRLGTKFHEARGKSYCKGGYTKLDVLGCLIVMPNKNPTAPQSCKDKPLVRFKSHLYYEVKDPANEEKKDEMRAGSKIYFFKNGICQGEAFSDIYDGTYFPAISIYKSVRVAVNFGPKFSLPPKDAPCEFLPMQSRAEELTIEETLSDLVYLTENDGKLTLDKPVALPH